MINNVLVLETDKLYEYFPEDLERVQEYELEESEREWGTLYTLAAFKSTYPLLSELVDFELAEHILLQ